MNKEMPNCFSPFFWAVLGMETRAFCLLGKALTTELSISSPLAFYLEAGF